jgi:hypothetical protein
MKCTPHTKEYEFTHPGNQCAVFIPFGEGPQREHLSFIPPRNFIYWIIMPQAQKTPGMLVLIWTAHPTFIVRVILSVLLKSSFTIEVSFSTVLPLPIYSPFSCCWEYVLILDTAPKEPMLLEHHHHHSTETRKRKMNKS